MGDMLALIPQQESNICSNLAWATCLQCWFELDGGFDGLSDGAFEKDGWSEGVVDGCSEIDGGSVGVTDGEAERDGCIDGLSEGAFEMDGVSVGVSEGRYEEEGISDGSERKAQLTGTARLIRKAGHSGLRRVRLTLMVVRKEASTA